jgi:hypothetical protein
VHSKNRRGDKRMNTAMRRYGRAAALVLKNVIVLGNPFRFTKDNIDQFNF